MAILSSASLLQTNNVLSSYSSVNWVKLNWIWNGNYSYYTIAIFILKTIFLKYKPLNLLTYNARSVYPHINLLKLSLYSHGSDCTVICYHYYHSNRNHNCFIGEVSNEIHLRETHRTEFGYYIRKEGTLFIRHNTNSNIFSLCIVKFSCKK